ncbi:hypothetical protein Acr_04g0005450 [Actinidia rufa]|uniref:Uncharacterized protein n=1 Tax=Actinidia rufa TaxID=165716 RepID=A0A7J0EJK8_9ERIC|nr:hypothetical protein Acr_04g0005450 [Actinidia rufa]
MVVPRRRVLPLIVIAALGIFEDRVSIPFCKVVVPAGEQNVEEDHPDDLKVMMVANFLLLSSEAGYRSIFFLDYYLSKFFAVCVQCSYIFCVRTHSHGTREITVPAMTWNARNDPGFVVATFKSNGRVEDAKPLHQTTTEMECFSSLTSWECCPSSITSDPSPLCKGSSQVRSRLSLFLSCRQAHAMESNKLFPQNPISRLGLLYE